MAYIYIATNETLWHNDNGTFTPLIKIGYTSQDDVDQRMNQLNRATSAAGRFVKYATYEIAPIAGTMPDKLVHKIIQSIDPALRLDENKEYFIWRPEEAFRFFESMARLHGCEHKLVRYDGDRSINVTNEPPVKRHSAPPANFAKLGIQVGSVLHYVADPEITCTVHDARRVVYHGEVCSLSGLTQRLRNCGSIQGTAWFVYQGRTIAELWAVYCADHPSSSSD